ncbi:hypothetical protein [Fodinibius sp. SL11]|uniref:hypothetical protein n=1 Tax=Fodinibius sp. SL11 TaxID=3425690 RepID=UPI003F8824B7
MNEFEIYDKIVNGTYRPHLKDNDTNEWLEELEKNFFTSTLRIEERELEGRHLTTFDDIDFDFYGIKDGDRVVLEFPDEDNDLENIVLKVEPNPEEQELINLDIRPPIDKKSEIYLRIIEGEFRRIKASSKKKLESSEDFEKLKLYALKNIQTAKRIGREAHQLKKKLSKSGIDDMNNSNTLILYYIKLHIIYSINHIQVLFKDILGLTVQNRSTLEDELYELQYSKWEAKSNQLDGFFKESEIDRLYEELGENEGLEQSISFFKEKLTDQIEKVEKEKKSSFGVAKMEVDKLKWRKEELGKLLIQKIFKSTTASNENKLIARYKYLVETLRNLNLNQYSLEYKALDKVDFFPKVETEISLLKDLIEVDSTVIDSSHLIDDLMSLLLLVQASKHDFKGEGQINRYLSNLLRARQYYVADESRQGRSGTDKSKNYKSGELDIAIRDIENNGIVKTIIEAFQLKSCGEDNKNVEYHIDKLLDRYDTAGNKENYIIVYAKADDFISLWEKYQKYIKNKVFETSVNFEKIERKQINKRNLKVGLTKIPKGKTVIKLYHLFVNMYLDD